MFNRLIALAVVFLTLVCAPWAQAQTEPPLAAEAPYGYVELVGPRSYAIVGGDTLWDLSPDQWRTIQAANPKLSESGRISTTRSGLYRVQLNVNELINIPAGITIRVRLERPANFVDNPEQGGTPFVEGGVSPEQPQAVREQALDAAAREYNRNNVGSTLRPEDFVIVGNIQTGTLHGPGVVFFADRPNEGRPTMYDGERGYRARVRNLRTGQESEQMFLQACGNDARTGEFLRGGEGFRFVPDGTILGSSMSPVIEEGSGVNWGKVLLYFLAGLALIALVSYLVMLRMPVSRRPNLPFLGKYNPKVYGLTSATPTLSSALAAPVVPTTPPPAPAAQALPAVPVVPQPEPVPTTPAPLPPAAPAIAPVAPVDPNLIRIEIKPPHGTMQYLVKAAGVNVDADLSCEIKRDTGEITMKFTPASRPTSVVAPAPSSKDAIQPSPDARHIDG